MQSILTPETPCNPALTPWEAAVAQVAQRARLSLGEASHSRIDKGVTLVLSGSVTLGTDCTGYVTSQSRPLATYAVNGTCPCKDAEHAPSGLCKHRIALGLYRRALEQAEPPDTAPAPERPREAVSVPAPQAAPVPLGEAPVSVNVRLVLAGRDVQLTLRGTDEQAVLERLHLVLAQYPVSAEVAPSPVIRDSEGWCRLHNVPMRQSRNPRGSWWSHKHEDGWCKGR